MPETINQIEAIFKWQTDRNLHVMPYIHANEMKNIIEEIFEAENMTSEQARAMAGHVINDYNIERTTTPKSPDFLFDIIVYAVGAIAKLGYEPTKVIAEGLKEIECRCGSYCEEAGKYIKQPSVHTYKADYSTCKL